MYFITLVLILTDFSIHFKAFILSPVNSYIVPKLEAVEYLLGCDFSISLYNLIASLYSFHLGFGFMLSTILLGLLFYYNVKLGFIAFFIMLSNASAQSPTIGFPDAGSLLNQIERSLPPPKLPVVGAPAAPPKIDLLKGSGETFVLNRILFEGNLAIKSLELEKITAPYLHRGVFFADLQNLAAVI